MAASQLGEGWKNPPVLRQVEARDAHVPCPVPEHGDRMDVSSPDKAIGVGGRDVIQDKRRFFNGSIKTLDFPFCRQLHAIMVASDKLHLYGVRLSPECDLLDEQRGETRMSVHEVPQHQQAASASPLEQPGQPLQVMIDATVRDGNSVRSKSPLASPVDIGHEHDRAALPVQRSLWSQEETLAKQRQLHEYLCVTFEGWSQAQEQ